MMWHLIQSITMEASVIMLIIAVIGGLVSGVLGWNDSGEEFDSRKFIGTLGRTVISALLAYLTFSGMVDPSLFDYVTVFLAGYGVDSLGSILGLKLPE